MSKIFTIRRRSLQEVMFSVVSVCKSSPYGGFPGSVETSSIVHIPPQDMFKLLEYVTDTSLSKRALGFRVKDFLAYVPLLELREETELLVASQK